MKRFTITSILYKSKRLADQSHPITIRISVSGQRAYYSIGHSAKPEQWDVNKNAPKRSHPQYDIIRQTVNYYVGLFESTASELNAKGEFFTASILLERVKRPTRSMSVQEFLKEEVASLQYIDNLGNAAAYKTLLNVINRYQGGALDIGKKRQEGRPLFFSQIDYGWLLKFERDLRKRGVGDGGLSFYFRTLRAAYNLALKQHILDPVEYPFREFSISKRFRKAEKRSALTKADIHTIESLELPQWSDLSLARDILLFSYYSRGMNFIDICNLKWSEITENSFEYDRRKTHRPFKIKLSTQLNLILDRYRSLTKRSDADYVFPIFERTKHVTEAQRYNKKSKGLTAVNKSLEQIAERAGIKIKLTTYVARHTFSRVLDSSGVSRDVIQEILGHQDRKTTNVYLDSLDDNRMDEAMSHI